MQTMTETLFETAKTEIQKTAVPRLTIFMVFSPTYIVYNHRMLGRQFIKDIIM